MKAAIVLAVLALAVTGCSTSQLPPETPSATSVAQPDVPYGAPAGIAYAGVDDLGVDYTAYNEAVVACLAELGWQASTDGNSVESGAVPLDQGARFENDSADCSAQHQALIPATPPLSPALITLNYERTSAAYRCLEGAGFSLAELPSQAAWAEGTQSGGGFSLYSELAHDQLEEANAYCANPEYSFFSPEIEIYADEVDYAGYWASVG
jgi:hypothetical protein